MIYLDSDMSKSTNTLVYFDWKTVIYIYICGKCRTQFMLPMEVSVTFTGACANEIILSINRSLVYKAKEGGHVRIWYNIIMFPAFDLCTLCLKVWFLDYVSIFCLFSGDSVVDIWYCTKVIIYSVQHYAVSQQE